MLAAADDEEPVKLPKDSNAAETYEEQTECAEIRIRKESDAASDAGTYVVDRDPDQEEEIRARLQIDRVSTLTLTSTLLQ